MIISFIRSNSAKCRKSTSTSVHNGIGSQLRCQNFVLNLCYLCFQVLEFMLSTLTPIEKPNLGVPVFQWLHMSHIGESILQDLHCRWASQMDLGVFQLPW